MASGSFSGTDNGQVKCKINWSSSKGNGGSTVYADLIAQNINKWYFDANVYYGYNLSINGNNKSGSGGKLSGSVNGSVTLLSHSIWVGYTGNKSININGNINLTGILNGGTISCSGSAALDKVGEKPPVPTCTAPGGGAWSEKTTSITVKWNRSWDYSGGATYTVYMSHNGGGYTSIASGLGNATLSYTKNISPRPGDTYQFAVEARNDIGSSGWSYSGKLTLNYLSPPSIGNISTFNPFVNNTLWVPLSGGGQYDGSGWKRCANIHVDGGYKYAGAHPSSNGNSGVNITVNANNIMNDLGTSSYSNSNRFTVVAWCENANGTRSGYVSKAFTVNINTDGGATPTLGLPSFSGGILDNPSTCFVVGVNNLHVTSPNASLRRAPSGTSLSYKIQCTGHSIKNGTSVDFSVNSSGIKTVTVTATDSRGLSTSVSKQVMFQQYYPPMFKNVSGARMQTPDTSAQITYTIEYSPIYQYTDVNTKGNQLNGISYQHYSKDDGGTWNPYTSGTQITGLNTDLVYNIQLCIADKVKPKNWIYEYVKIPTIKVGLALRPSSIGVNCVPQKGRALDVKGVLNASDSLMVNGRNIFDIMFPVGAVYITYNDNNPQTFLGGTWIRFGQGRVLVGEGTGNDGSTSMTFTTESSGGEYKHLLSWQEMPPHNHYQNINAFGYHGWDDFTTNGYCGIIDSSSSNYHAPNKKLKVARVGMETYTNEAGLGQTHNNIQPYITVYYWRRTN